MTEEKEVKKGESKVADAAWLRDTAERHRAFAGNSGGWFIGRTLSLIHRGVKGLIFGFDRFLRQSFCISAVYRSGITRNN